MVYRRFEVLFDCPISNAEVEWLSEELKDDQHAVLSKSGRLMLVDGFEDIYTLIKELAKHEFVHDILNIREVVDYEAVHEEDEIQIDWIPEK